MEDREATDRGQFLVQDDTAIRKSSHAETRILRAIRPPSRSQTANNPGRRAARACVAFCSTPSAGHGTKGSRGTKIGESERVYHILVDGNSEDERSDGMTLYFHHFTALGQLRPWHPCLQ